LQIDIDLRGVGLRTIPDLHEKTRTLLVALTAYNIMHLLHELQAERARVAFDR
jgi:hypothetical protein